MTPINMVKHMYGILPKGQLDLVTKNQKDLIRISDANGDGKISKDEVPVFVQACTTLSYDGNSRAYSVNIGGARMKLNDIKSVKQNNRQYTVLLNNGITAEYEQQSVPRKACCISSVLDFANETNAYFNGFDNSLKITGTPKNDVISIQGGLNSIDGGAGNDSVHTYDKTLLEKLDKNTPNIEKILFVYGEETPRGTMVQSQRYR